MQIRNRIFALSLRALFIGIIYFIRKKYSIENELDTSGNLLG